MRMGHRKGDWKIAVLWWGLILSITFAAWARGEKEVEIRAIPQNPMWNGHDVVNVKLLVRVDSERITAYCVFWGDGERSCRDVDEQPYTEYVVHPYKTCVYDGDPRNGPIERIVVGFAAITDGKEKKVLQAEARIMFVGCGR